MAPSDAYSEIIGGVATLTSGSTMNGLTDAICTGGSYLMMAISAVGVELGIFARHCRAECSMPVDTPQLGFSSFSEFGYCLLNGFHDSHVVMKAHAIVSVRPGIV